MSGGLKLKIVESHEEDWFPLSEDELFDFHLEQLKTPNEIARETGLVASTVRERLVKLDAYIPNIHIIAKGYPPEIPFSDEELIDLHVNHGYSPTRIAKEYGKSRGVYIYKLKKLGVYIPRQSSREYEKKELPISDEELINLHVNKKRTIFSIWKQFGGNRTAAYITWLNRVKSLGQFQGDFGCKDKYEIGVDWERYDIEHLYKYTTVSIEQLAKMYGVGVYLIRRKLKELDIYDWRENHFIDKNGQCHSHNEIISLYVDKGINAQKMSEMWGRSAYFYRSKLRAEGIYVKEKPNKKYDSWSNGEHDLDLKRLFLDEWRGVSSIFSFFDGHSQTRIKTRIRLLNLSAKRKERISRGLSEKDIQALFDRFKEEKNWFGIVNRTGLSKNKLKELFNKYDLRL